MPIKLGQVIFFIRTNSEGRWIVKRDTVIGIENGIYQTRNHYEVSEFEVHEKYSHARHMAEENNRRVR